MAIYKNKASQKITVYAYSSQNGVAKTADAANITARISLDGAASAATNDVNPTELDATNHPGIYIFDATQAETNADMIVLSAKSATTKIVIYPIIVYTEPETRAADLIADTITASKFDESTAFPLTAADTGATQVARTGADADTLETLSDEIAAGGGGGGDPWLTAIPGAYAAGTAGYIVGTNVDAPVSDVPTVAEFEARTLLAASYFDPAADTVANVTTVGSVTGAVGSVTGDTKQTADVATLITTVGVAGAGLTALATQASVDGVPTNAEFELRTLPSADYVVVGDTIAAVTTVGSVTGAVGSVTGAVGSVTGAVGSVTGNVGGIAGTIQTLDALDTAQDTQHGTTQTAIAALPTDADVQTAAAAALTAYDPPTKAEQDTAFTEIKGATWSALTDTLEHIRDKETDIETDTQDLQTQVGVDGAGLTALPWNAAWDAEVQSEATDALNAYDPPTRAELTTDTNAIIAQVDANEAKIDTVDLVVDAIKVVSDKLADTLELDGAVYRFTANALEEAPGGTGGAGDASQATLLLVKATTDKLDTGLELDGAVYRYTQNALELAPTASYSLSTAAAALGAVVSGTAIAIYRGDTATIALTGLGNISTRTKLYWTVKRTRDNTDVESMVQVEETGGLLHLNGATTTTTNATMTVTNATTGAVTIVLKAAATAALNEAGGLYYDVQMVTATAVTTLTTGAVSITGDVTRATT